MRAMATNPLSKSLVHKRCVRYGPGGARKQTSISIEPAFWEAFKAIAKRQGVGVDALLDQVAEQHGTSGATNFSSSVRLFVLREVRARAEARDV